MENPEHAPQIPQGIFANNFWIFHGDPSKRNKLFFFNNTEWIRVRSASPTNYTIIDPGSVRTLAPASQAFSARLGLWHLMFTPSPPALAQPR